VAVVFISGGNRGKTKLVKIYKLINFKLQTIK